MRVFHYTDFYEARICSTIFSGVRLYLMLFKLDDKCEKYGENFIDAVRLSMDFTVRIFWKPVTKEQHDVGSLYKNFAVVGRNNGSYGYQYILHIRIFEV
jgi:hypothetical protein